MVVKIGNKKSIKLSEGNWDLSDEFLIQKISNKKWRRLSKQGIIDFTEKIDNWMIPFLIALTMIVLGIILVALNIIVEILSPLNLMLWLITYSMFSISGFLGYSQFESRKSRMVMTIATILSLITTGLTIVLIILMIL